MQSLIRKYNVPGPRYTSYPTVPVWQSDSLDLDNWTKSVKKTFDATNHEDGISLYIHLPYCESLCTYCGCNTRITVNHALEEPYINTVLKEWQMYLEIFEDVPEITEIHLGGGTPTFFSPENLAKLIEGIKSTSVIKENAEFGFEGHPNSTTIEHLQTLYNLGFRRLSLGIQDFDPVVQDMINRIQTYDQVKSVVDEAREIGYTSINFDLIYGLPCQKIRSIEDTFEKVSNLKPDRIAFYSYAHVPWVKPGQRKFTEADLPNHEDKRALYELGKVMLEEMGYEEIGMDHFSLRSDDLFKSATKGTMHRNFMGYTTNHSLMSLGLGVSAISDTWSSYGQNIKTVEAYRTTIEEGTLPIFKNHFLTTKEEFMRKHITNLMCRFETTWSSVDEYADLMVAGLSQLKEMERDRLINILPGKIQVLEKGRPFVRNVCMAIDFHFQEQSDSQQVFSQTI